MQTCFQWIETILNGSRMLIQQVRSVRGYSSYVTVWQTTLTGGLEESISKRTNTNLRALYLFLAWMRPPDPDLNRNKYTEDITDTQEHFQSKSQNVCNQLVITSSMYLTFSAQLWEECNIEDVILSSTLNHFVRRTSTGAISPNSSTGAMCLSWTPNFNVYVQEHIYWLDSDICRLVQIELRFLRYFTDAWEYTSTRLLHLPRISSSSSRSTTYLSQGYGGYMVYILVV